jgi:hypothetical protein
MGTNARRIVLIMSFSVLLVPGCAATRHSKEQKMTVGDRFHTAWMETAIFTSETVPMAILSPVFGVPDEQKDLKWYQRRLP